MRFFRHERLFGRSGFTKGSGVLRETKHIFGVPYLKTPNLPATTTVPRETDP